jgi:hypothetical protein
LAKAFKKTYNIVDAVFLVGLNLVLKLFVFHWLAGWMPLFR